MAKREQKDIIDFSKPSTTPLGQVIPASELWKQILTKESLIRDINDALQSNIKAYKDFWPGTEFYSNEFAGVIVITPVSQRDGAAKSYLVEFAYYDRDDDESDPAKVERYTSIVDGLESFLVDGKKLYDFCPLIYQAMVVDV